jgi:hypothetical protein
MHFEPKNVIDGHIYIIPTHPENVYQNAACYDANIGLVSATGALASEFTTRTPTPASLMAIPARKVIQLTALKSVYSLTRNPVGQLASSGPT